MVHRPLIYALLTIALTALVAEARPPRGKLPRRTNTRAKALSAAAQRRAATIRRFANKWMGTNYQWGGHTRGGIDCSGYSREMYRRVFNLELPRTTRTQIKLGQEVPISTSALGAGFEPGDLFFYVDPAGIPNHVVVYMGNGQFTHSASGRGVVVDGFKALWGRRIVGRRVLFPARGGGKNKWAPIPAAPAFVPTAVPCPPRIRANPDEFRKYRTEPLLLDHIKNLPPREICKWKALATALRRRGGEVGKRSAGVVDGYVEWLESIDSFKDEQF